MAADKGDWDALVARSRIPHVLFRRDYMEYHSERFADASLVIHDGPNLVAALPASRDGNVVTSHGGLTFGGFVTGASMTIGRMLAIFDAVLAELRDAEVERLLYAPAPHVYHLVPAEDDLYALFRHGARLVRRDASSAIRLDERVPPNKGRRSGATRGARLGVTCAPSAEWAAFMQLEEDVLRTRHHTTPTHSTAEIVRLAGLFPEAIRLYCAHLDGDLVAGVVVYETPCVAHAQYIAVNDRGREIDAGTVLITYLLQDIYPAKRYFDFGISTLQAGTVLNAGLAQSKESYGARTVVYDRYEVLL